MFESQDYIVQFIIIMIKWHWPNTTEIPTESKFFKKTSKFFKKTFQIVKKPGHQAQ